MMDLNEPPQEEGNSNAGNGMAEIVDCASLNADQQQAVKLMEELCAAAGQEAQVVVRSVQPPYLNVELLGEEVSETWGRLGQGLDALQFLCNLILSRRVSSDLRLTLDAEGYRERRAETLRQLAIELANEVKERNEEAELQPLPAHERRIIHNALLGDPEVTTYSEGEEPGRHIVIAPRR